MSVFVGGIQPMLTEVDTRTHRVNRVITEANSEWGDVHIAFNSIWLCDNVGDLVYGVPLMNR